MLIIAIAITQACDLFAAVILTGIFSLTSACLLVMLDAVDVAFTEASVGAGIATLLFVSTLALIKGRETRASKISWPALLTVFFTGAMLMYGVSDIPEFGEGSAPVHQHIAERYIQDAPHETGVPNMVTAVLASYRGYDTLGETTVILTAGIGVLLLLGGNVRSKQEKT